MVAEQSYPHKRKYRPLDVKTWFEGFLRLLGWILVIIFSVVTGVVFIMYELKVLNMHDVDWRDMDFDQRITNDVNNRYHKNFLLAEQCCNPDPLFYPSCPMFPWNGAVVSDPWSYYSPTCKPVIMIECPDVTGSACNSVRQVLYDAVGMSPTPGTPYVNCLRAGRVRVGAQQVPSGRPIMLTAYSTFEDTIGSLTIPFPFETNATEVRGFVDWVAASVNQTAVDYMQPSSPLSAAVYLAGQQVSAALTLQYPAKRGLKALPPWTQVSPLWPWPGMDKRCKNTAVDPAYFLYGTVSIALPRFSLVRPQDAVIPLTVANSTLLLAAWSVGPAEAPGNTVGGDTNVNVSYLSGIQVALGQVPMLGACGGWQLSPDPHDLVLNYTTYWTGSLAALQAGTTFGPLTDQVVRVNVTDVAAPRYFQLPRYGGMWYIVLAFGMAAIWMFGTGLILFVIILVWWNIRSNKGLPPIVYRYMRKYRGW